MGGMVLAPLQVSPQREKNPVHPMGRVPVLCLTRGGGYSNVTSDFSGTMFT